MNKQVYSLSISARAVLNMHSLNNEGGEGNQIQTRMVDLVYYDENGEPRQANVNAISGDTFKHIQAQHLHRIATEKGLTLCTACQRFDANRMSADPDFREWLQSKPTQVEILDRLVGNCTIDDLEGNLITEGGSSVPRKSVAEFGWVVGIPEAVTTDDYFHVKYVPDRREKSKDKEENKGNLGQSIFHRPASSGVYAIVSNFEVSRIGYNDINQTYIEGVDRQKRYAALLESILYTFIQMNGAMRNTQLPHLVALHGVVAVSHGIAPAPTVSPLNPKFADEITGTQNVLNGLHGSELIAVHKFADMTELAEVMSSLIQSTSPYTVKVGGNKLAG